MSEKTSNNKINKGGRKRSHTDGRTDEYDSKIVKKVGSENIPEITAAEIRNSLKHMSNKQARA